MILKRTDEEYKRLAEKYKLSKLEVELIIRSYCKYMSYLIKTANPNSHTGLKMKVIDLGVLRMSMGAAKLHRKRNNISEEEEIQRHMFKLQYLLLYDKELEEEQLQNYLQLLKEETPPFTISKFIKIIKKGNTYGSRSKQTGRNKDTESTDSGTAKND